MSRTEGIYLALVVTLGLVATGYELVKRYYWISRRPPNGEWPDDGQHRRQK